MVRGQKRKVLGEGSVGKVLAWALGKSRGWEEGPAVDCGVVDGSKSSASASQAGSVQRQVAPQK